MPYSDYNKKKENALKNYYLNKEIRRKQMLDRHNKEMSTPSGHIRILARLAVARGKRKGINYDNRIIDYLAKNPPILCVLCNKEIRYSGHEGVGPDSRKDCPSVDRIKPELGYVISNVRIICTHCNGKKWVY